MYFYTCMKTHSNRYNASFLSEKTVSTSTVVSRCVNHIKNPHILWYINVVVSFWSFDHLTFPFVSLFWPLIIHLSFSRNLFSRISFAFLFWQRPIRYSLIEKSYHTRYSSHFLFGVWQCHCSVTIRMKCLDGVNALTHTRTQRNPNE